MSIVVLPRLRYRMLILLLCIVAISYGVWKYRFAEPCDFGSDRARLLTLEDFLVTGEDRYVDIEECEGMPIDITGSIGVIDDIVPYPRTCDNGTWFQPLMVVSTSSTDTDPKGWFVKNFAYDTREMNVYKGDVFRLKGRIQSCTITVHDTYYCKFRLSDDDYSAESCTYTQWYLQIEDIQRVSNNPNL